MHPCLEIPEILNEICEQISELLAELAPPYNEPWYKALSSLARSCQRFKDPALNALWKEPPEVFQTLAMVMPPDLWTCGYREWEGSECLDLFDEMTTLRLVRKLTERDWERYDYYAPKIRNFTLQGFDYGISNLALKKLCEYRTHRLGKPVLPNLNRVWFFVDEELLAGPGEYLPGLLGSSLQHLLILSLYSEGNLPPDIRHFLQRVSQISPNLRSLQTTNISKTVEHNLTDSANNFGGLPTDFSLGKLLQQWPFLESLHISMLDLPEVWRDVSRLPSLRELKLGLSSDSWPTDHVRLPDLIRQDAPFPHLRSLTISKVNLTLTNDILDRLPNALTELTLDPTKTADATNQLSRLMQQVAQFADLEYLSLNLLNAFPRDKPDLRWYLPIFSIHSVRVVYLRGIPMAYHTIDWFPRIAENWTHLEELEIPPTNLTQEAPQMTLEAFSSWVQECRQLKKFTGSLFCRPFNLDFGGRTEQKGSNRLEALILVESPLENPKAVEKCLRAAFPRLECVEGMDISTGRRYHSEPQAPEWEELEAKFSRIKI